MDDPSLPPKVPSGVSLAEQLAREKWAMKVVELVETYENAHTVCELCDEYHDNDRFVNTPDGTICETCACGLGHYD